jgi:SAM-dependent methyltransferase
MRAALATLAVVAAVLGRRAVTTAQPDLAPADRPRTSGMTNRGWDSYSSFLPPGGPAMLSALIDELVAARNSSARTRGKPFRILELGAGEGHVLMQLKARYPWADVVGVNKFNWLKTVGGAQNSANPEVLLRAARAFGITNLTARTVPRIVDHTLPNPLPFEPASFDVVLSQHTLNHMLAGRRVAVLQDVQRVLAEGGLGLVMWTGYKANPPAFPDGRFQLVARSAPVVKASRATTSALGAYRCCVDTSNHALGRNAHAFANVVVLSAAGVTAVSYEAVVAVLDAAQASSAPTTLERIDAEEAKLTAKSLGLPLVARWVAAEAVRIARANEKARLSRGHRR